MGMKIDLLYPDLSYKIIGCAFDVFNEIGSGHKEKIYHASMSISMKKLQMEHINELYYPVKYQNETVGKNYFDFLVEKSIVVEIKTSDRFTKKHFEQLENYLTVSGYKLGILIAFTKTQVKYHRVLNLSILNKEKTSSTLS